jgi:hypothetical protein
MEKTEQKEVRMRMKIFTSCISRTSSNSSKRNYLANPILLYTSDDENVI